MKKIFLTVPVIGLMACTDYQANWEESWSAQDAVWQEQEYQQQLQEQQQNFVCNEGDVQMVSDYYDTGYGYEYITRNFICYNNTWNEIIDNPPIEEPPVEIPPTEEVPPEEPPLEERICNEGEITFIDGEEPLYFICINNERIPYTPSSSSVAPPPPAYIEGTNVLSGGNFQKTCSTGDWETTVKENLGSIKIGLSNNDACKLKFSTEETIEGEWILQASHSVTLHYGYAYQIIINGTADIPAFGASAYVEISSDDNKFMEYAINLNSEVQTWESEIVNYCDASETVNFTIKGGADLSGFAISKIQVIRRPSKC